VRLEWSRSALEDRDNVFDYIAQDHPQAAVMVDDRIRARVEILSKFPKMGRPGRIEGTRELMISRTPYIVAYRVEGETVRILRVLHGAQLWPDELHEK